MVTDSATVTSENSMDFFHWTNSELENVDTIGDTKRPDQIEIRIGIWNSVNHCKDMIYLVHQSSEMMDDVLKVIHVIIKAIENCSSWCDIKELIDWCFHYRL